MSVLPWDFGVSIHTDEGALFQLSSRVSSGDTPIVNRSQRGSREHVPDNDTASTESE